MREIFLAQGEKMQQQESNFILSGWHPTSPLPTPRPCLAFHCGITGTLLLNNISTFVQLMHYYKGRKM
jgi:hypothetical protein